MAFDVAIGFTVETKELINARNALQSLAQTAKDLNSNQEKAAKAADSLVEANKKIAETSEAAAKATEKSEKAAKSFAGEGDAAASKLSKLKDQLSFLRDDLNLSEVGFTKSQAGVLAWAKSVGASSGIIKEFASTFDNLNKVSGINPFDQSAKGLSSLNSELRELKQVQSLAADGIGLTAKQVQMLSRDLEGIRQQNEAFGRSAEEGVQKHRAAFIEAASSVNSYKEQVKLAQRETENLFQAEQELARNRKLVNDDLIKGWGAGIGKKSQALSDLAAQYSEEERLALAHQAKMQQINSTAGNAAADEYYRRQAAASKIAADAIDQLERDTRKLITTNEYLDRGFTSSSANALFRYKEALQATGVSALELKQKLYLLEQDLMKRQNTSPFAKMQQDVKKVTEQTGHLARAISVQLGDVAISLAGGQNPFVVLLQQGDQIRGAVQQAVDAGQSIDKAMKGAFVSMANSAKLVGVVIKEFAMDGLRSVSDALQVVGKYTTEVNAINKRYEDGTISLTRSQRLLTVQSLLLDKAMGTLRIVALGTAAVFGGVLLKAFYDLSKEQDSMAKSNAQFGAIFGATTQETVAMTKSLMDVGISSAVARNALQAMQETGSLTKDSFMGIATAAADAQKYVGISVEDTVKKFGEIAKDPVKVLSEFTQETGYLSQAQLQLVRDLVEAGNGAEAQRVAIKLLEEGYKSMSAQAQDDMSAVGRATVTLKDSTSTLWDEFKNSSTVEIALNGVKIALGILNGAVQGVVVSAKVLWATMVAAGKGVKALYENALDPSNLKAVFAQIGNEWTGAIDKALQDGADSVNNFAKAADGASGGTAKFTAEQRKLNAEAEQVSLAFDKMNKSNEEHAKKLVKNLDLRTYVGKRIMEENKELTKNFNEDQKKSFYSSEQYKTQILASEKRFQKEWQDAHKKREGKPKETYQVNRDNELQETKKFYDAQLKQLKDFESKQSQINKAAFESKAISYGEYVAKEIELVTSSQQQQLAIIEKSEAAYRANIESRKKAQESAAAAAIKGGANSSKINDKLSQELKNLSNESRTAEEGFKGLRSALENSANAKYAEFYKELAKSLYDSNEELKKFSKSVDDNARRRKEDLALEQELLGVYGAEADALKASTSTMRGYEGAVRSANEELDKAVKRRTDLQEQLSTVVGVEAYNKLSGVIDEAVKTENQLRLNAIETEKKARLDANQAGADAALAYNLRTFKEMRDSLSESIYDALFEGGKSGGDALKNVLKKMFKNYVINVFINPITNQIAGSVLGSLGIGGSSGSGGILGSANNLSSIYNAFSGSLVSSIGSAVGTLGSLIGSSAVTSFASGMAGITGAGAITGASTGAGLGLSLGSSLGGSGLGLSAGAATSGVATSVGAGSSAAAGLGASFAAAIPWIAGGLALISSWDSLFGRKLKDSGIEGTFGGEQGFTGNSFKFYKGGLFRSDKTEREALDQGTQKALSDQFNALRSGTTVMAQALGLGTDAIEGFTSSVKVSFNGLDEAGISKALAEEFNRISNELAKATLGTDAYTKSGESSTATLVRLSGSLVDVNRIFTTLGVKLFDISLAGADAAFTFTELFGSISNFSDLAISFYENFYSEGERVLKTREAQMKALYDLGFYIDPATGDKAKKDFRKVVEDALNSGQTQLAANLLKMSEAFAQTAEYGQQLIEAVRDKAKKAADSTASSFESAYNSVLAAEDLLAKLGDSTSGAASKQLKEQRLWSAIAKADYKDQITLAGQLTDLVLERHKAEQDNAKKMIEFGKSLVKYVESLRIGNLSPLTTGQKLAEAAKQYSDTLRKAQAGDEDAMSSLQGISSSYLELARTYFASSEDYTNIFNNVTGALESLGISSQSEAQQQLEISSQNLSELKKIESLVNGAYAKANTDFGVQKNLLQIQIEQLLRTANGIEAVRDILSGLPPELAGQINSGGVTGKPGGVGTSSFDVLAQQYLDILGNKSGTQDLGYIAAAMANLNLTNWTNELNNALALLQDEGSRNQLKSLFDNLAKLNGLAINGSHKNGLDYVPYDGYVAELHQGERVLTANENRSYGVQMAASSSSLVAEVRLLREEVKLLRSENREDSKMQAAVTAKSGELTANTIVEGVAEATSKETYSNNLGAKLR